MRRLRGIYGLRLGRWDICLTEQAVLIFTFGFFFDIALALWWIAIGLYIQTFHLLFEFLSFFRKEHSESFSKMQNPFHTMCKSIGTGVIL